ncbi:hypothetical protein MVEN_01376100 [Mycena venus]|uniref:F-box domain-containing protein n=1 Tax=Mycena venus TaxID=2733690 RepID=A0A8H6XUU3_9AGAR|nr:hypothetical protein MVEN_01376100 [Mycena venus]
MDVDPTSTVAVWREALIAKSGVASLQSPTCLLTTTTSGVPRLKMEEYESPWSPFGIPPEIALEIAAHNADDVASLRAMSIVSKAMRFLAIDHLFSFIHFACEQDFSTWETMVRRTPRLSSIVKKVKFDDPDLDSKYGWLKCFRSMDFPDRLFQAVVPPRIPTMPNVRAVEWDAFRIDTTMWVAYMSLFPNMKELHFTALAAEVHQLDDLLGACGRLSVLSFRRVEVLHNGQRQWGIVHQPPAKQQRPPLDLSALEGLSLTDSETIPISNRLPGIQEYLISLVEGSPPTGLKSITFGAFCEVTTSTMERILPLAVTSLTNLCLLLPAILGEIFSALPSFPALDVFSIRLTQGKNQAADIINALAAPNLTTLLFRIDAFDEHRHQTNILNAHFPWGSDHFESMKTVLTRKFPLLRRIGFHFLCRGFQIRLEETGADVAEYLELGWFDGEDNPVVYSKANGKPSWKWPAEDVVASEPETEDSDCYLDEDSDGNEAEWVSWYA